MKKMGLVSCNFLLLALGVNALSLEEYADKFRTTWPELVEIRFSDHSVHNIVFVSPQFLPQGFSESDKKKSFMDTPIIASYPELNRTYAVFLPPSNDNYWEFKPMYLMIKKPNQTDLEYESKIQGNIICFAPNGSIYTVSRASWYNSKFFIYRKYSLKDGIWAEDPQGMLFVGQQTVANENIEVFSEPALIHRIGSIVKNSQIELIGLPFASAAEFSIMNQNVALVLGASGICGWIIDKVVGFKPPYIKYSENIELHSLDILNNVTPGLD